MPGEVIEKGILLTFDEIRILLYGMGVSQIEGIYMPEKIFCEEEVISAMHHLVEAGFVEAGEEKFLIRKDVRFLLGMMAAPEWTDIWTPSNDGGPAFFLYGKGEHVAVSERFWRKKDMLKLSVFDRESFEKWREEFTDDYRRD